MISPITPFPIHVAEEHGMTFDADELSVVFPLMFNPTDQSDDNVVGLAGRNLQALAVRLAALDPNFVNPNAINLMDREVANPNPGPVRRWAVNVPEYYEEAWFGITFSNVSYLQTFISSLAPLFSRDPKEHKSYRVSVTWHTSAVMMRTQRRKAYEMAYKRANEIAADTLSMMGHRTDSHLTVQRIANVTCAAEELEEVEDDVSLKSLLAHEPFQFTTRVNVDVEYLCHPHA